ncbi:hypothetical protein D3C87_1902850 [compost metagenome]
MVLDGFDPEPGFAQDLVGKLDFAQVVIRDADMSDLTAFQQRNQVWSPPPHIGWIVNPVKVDVVGAEVGQTPLQHVRHRRVAGSRDPRVELRGELVIAASVSLQYLAEHGL